MPVYVIALLSVLLLLRPAGSAEAQENSRNYSSFVTPFPNNGVYKVLVIGDALAEGTYLALNKAFRGDTTIQLFNEAKYGTGFSRRIYIGRDKEFNPLLASIKPDIVVVSVGATDAMAPILEENKKHLLGSPRWAELYSDRLNEFLQRLKRDHIGVYWVGLPIMQNPQVNENMNTLNDMFREKAHLNNAKFIDTWNGFVDQYGNYSPYGPDLDGRVERLRTNDGVLFTDAGYEKLANYVEREIRRDLISARSERNVPLAGDADEQNEITRKTGVIPIEPGNAANAEGNDDAAAARKIATRTTSSAALFGELIASDRASGLTILSSVTRVNDPSLAGGQHTLPLNLRPYYRVLVKGEAVAPKPGRADDFTRPSATDTTSSTTP